MEFTKVTFADIDKTAIGGVSSITLELIKCKQALNRVISHIDYLSETRVISKNISFSENGGLTQKNGVALFRKSADMADIWLNSIIASNMEASLMESNYKNI